jgi:hypothetical protein
MMGKAFHILPQRTVRNWSEKIHGSGDLTTNYTSLKAKDSAS